MIQKTKKLNIPAQKQSIISRIMVIGDSQSGKSSFINKFATDKFSSAYTPTLGVDIVDKYMEIGGSLFYFNILDFSGKQEYALIRSQFYKETTVVLLFLDLSSKKSVDLADMWFNEAKQQNINCPIIVVGSKCDIKKVSLQPERYLNSRGASKCLQISSKDGTNINVLASQIAKICK